ncbi:hypothetical protein N7513_001129, partial [Penicillium frequentans]
MKAFISRSPLYAYGVSRQRGRNQWEKRKKKHNRYPFFLSALHVQIAGLPPIRTVLVFLFSAFKTNLICSDGPYIV